MRTALLLTIALVACKGSAPKETTAPEPKPALGQAQPKPFPEPTRTIEPEPAPAPEAKPEPEPEPAPNSLPAQGEKCPNGRCDEGLECVEYYGIAGARGPRFTSCEIRCKGDGDCPQGQRCATIADGPGQVCRP